MEKNDKIKIVILAGGKGKRMQSTDPKVLAMLRGKHMIKHLLESVIESEIDSKPIIIVGYKKELVIHELGDKYEYVTQEEQLGTAHAVSCAQIACRDAENIIVISGDQPFIKTETIKNLFNKHINSRAKLTITTSVVPDFSDWRKALERYGRILRENGKIIDKEYSDATEEQRNIKEVNVSCYAFNAEWLWKNIKKVKQEQNVQKEYYLTDLWQIATENGEKIETIQIPPEEALGANSKEELEILEGFV